jgi:anthranilate synthase/aminodeoxychorismate synthase-like glutamine amidotransferase
VCLGHQAIALAFGAEVIRHPVCHGHATPIHHCSTGLFADIPADAPMTRYHSLVVDPASLPADLIVTAWSDDHAIMGLRHRRFPIDGVQFHPESVLSEASGSRLLNRFLRYQPRRPQPPVPGTHARA